MWGVRQNYRCVRYSNIYAPPTHHTCGATMYQTGLQSDFWNFWTPTANFGHKENLVAKVEGLRVIDPELFEYAVRFMTSSFVDDVIIHCNLCFDPQCLGQVLKSSDIIIAL